MILPGIGEAFVPMRVRLLFALLLTVVVSPLIFSSLPPEPKPLLPFKLFIFGNCGGDLFRHGGENNVAYT